MLKRLLAVLVALVSIVGIGLAVAESAAAGTGTLCAASRTNTPDPNGDLCVNYTVNANGTWRFNGGYELYSVFGTGTSVVQVRNATTVQQQQNLTFPSSSVASPTIKNVTTFNTTTFWGSSYYVKAHVVNRGVTCIDYYVAPQNGEGNATPWYSC